MKAYLRKKRELLLGAAAFWILFGLVYFLYGLPAGPFAYGALLTAVLLAVRLTAAYPGYRRKITELTQMKRLAREDLICSQRPASEEEELYQETLRLLADKRKEQDREQKKELEDAKRYYALWSHQIKTPLAAMRLLLQEEGPDRRAMEQELLKAEQYVEMALQYQRMAGGTGDLLLAQHDLSALVVQAVKKTAPLFIYKKIKIVIGEMKETVVTDEKWLVFVLEQLLTNAVKYTKEGIVSVYRKDGELVIEDSGIGILEEDLPRVFEWGYTGLNGRLYKHSTGIGLSLCRQMLHKLGHDIRLESKPGEGTAVYLKLERESFAIE